MFRVTCTRLCRWIGEKLGIVEKDKPEDEEEEEEEEEEPEPSKRKGSGYPNKGFQPDAPRKGIQQ